LADQTCINDRCECPDGQVVGPNETCICGPVPCGSDASCCDDWFCNPDSGVCEVCRPLGAPLPNQASTRGCCSNSAANGICVNRCDTATDCQAGTGQICSPLAPGVPGICQCPSGTQIVPGGTCV
jgi:hypothetical protein